MMRAEGCVDEDRSWAEMLPEVLVKSFQRLPLPDMFLTVPLVCKAWRKASLDPSLWESIDLRDWVEDFGFSSTYVERMVKLVVNRSCGRLKDLLLSDYGTDDMLIYISERCNSLKGLSIAHSDITDSGIFKVAHRFPHLELLVISGCDGLSKVAIEELGKKCKALKWLERNGSDNCFTLVGSIDNDEEALAIAQNMPQLKHLEMVDTHISTSGLQALLEGCLNLEYLDVRRCRNIILKGPTLQKCLMLKEFYISDAFEEEYWDSEFEEIDIDYYDDTEEWFSPFDLDYLDY
eukprot:c24286_g1_i1 orf=378-1250(+)